MAVTLDTGLKRRHNLLKELLPRPAAWSRPACKMGHVGALAAVALALVGCAQWDYYNVPVRLNGQGHNVAAMDVKQRVVFSQLHASDAAASSPGNGGTDTNNRFYWDVVTCAEPSPDALTVAGASGSLSGSGGKTPTVLNTAFALSESGALVGLRTQSIQLLRDAMYRLCEGYAAGAMDRDEFQAQQRRFQSTMMGLIAIEQLTGPVVAAQALLTSNAAATAGAGAGSADVTAAQVRVDSINTTILSDQTDVDKKQIARDDKARLVQKNVDQAVGADESTKQSLADARPQLVNDQKLAEADLVAANRKLAADTRSRDAAQRALLEAQSRAGASASGNGQLGAIAANASLATSKELVKGVVDIVEEIDTSYMRDECLRTMREINRKSLRPVDTAFEADPSSLKAEAAKVKVDALTALVNVCIRVLTADADLHAEKQARKVAEHEPDTAKTAEATSPAPPAKPASDPSRKKTGKKG